MENVKSNIVVEQVAVAALRPHPKNYRSHPEDQIEHIKASIRQHGFYRNVVVAEDNTILAGHGVVIASKQLGLETVPVVRLPIDSESPAAMKVLVGDNELSHLAEDDDRQLTELLRSIKEQDELVGTGFDELMLASLVMVTRPASEIGSIDEAAEWVGMPDYQADSGPLFSLHVTFTSEEDRKKFCEQKSVKILKRTTQTWSARWPEDGLEDATSLRFVDKERLK